MRVVNTRIRMPAILLEATKKLSILNKERAKNSLMDQSEMAHQEF